MKLFIVRFIRRLMTQQIPVSAGIEPRLVGLPAPLADRKRHGRVRVVLFQGPHDIRDHLVRIERVLPALKDEGAKSEFMSLVRAKKDLLLCETVPLALRVSGADTAVEAVVPAVVGKFDQAAQIYLIAVILRPADPGLFKEVSGALLIPAVDQGGKFPAGKIARLKQLVDQGLCLIIHPAAPYIVFCQYQTLE